MVNNSLLEKPRPKLRKWKVLNLYAGIGGNRKLWDNVDVTAVEINPEIAKIYQDFFPDDEVITTDAHDYLLEHFKEFDFIWSSPPCPTHSRIRKVTHHQNPPIFPDMKLYEEILFLKGYFKGKWCIENVKSWYKPLIKPQDVANHYFWSNFMIPKIKVNSREHNSRVNVLQKRKGFNLSNYKIGIEKKLLLRNCVEPEVGKHILDCARKNIQQKLVIKDE